MHRHLGSYLLVYVKMNNSHIWCHMYELLNSSSLLLLAVYLKTWRNFTIALSHLYSNSQFAQPSSISCSLIDTHEHELITHQHSDHMSNHQCLHPWSCSSIVPPSLLRGEPTPPQPHYRATTVTRDDEEPTYPSNHFAPTLTKCRSLFTLNWALTFRASSYDGASLSSEWNLLLEYISTFNMTPLQMVNPPSHCQLQALECMPFWIDPVVHVEAQIYMWCVL
jgi:hypothetical protein